MSATPRTAVTPRFLSRGARLPVKSKRGEADTAATTRLAFLLDDAFRIPGTKIRFGWDTIVGLIPGIGDAATTVIALAPVATAWKLGAGRWLLARMLGNVAIDAVIGSIPVVGDAFDLFFKANRRNARLLQHFAASTRTS